MEKIIEAHEQNRITNDQGETMAKLFGPDCEFHSFSVSQFTEARKMLENLIRIVNEKNPAKIKLIKKERKKSKSRSSSVHSAKISPSGSIKSEPSSTSDTAATTNRRSSIVKKLSLKKRNSTVCAIS